MLRISTLAACALVMSGSLALAQTSNAPYGTNGSAPLRDVGTTTPNANATAGGGTQSTTMLKQEIKNESASGMSQSYGQGTAPGYAAPSGRYGYGTQQAYGGMSGNDSNPNGVCITDEYGYKYNCRGDRIGGPRR
ncbi:MAG: hypothetical protein JOY64_10950 [Alphaproteobacteria bacterium]|nr:hypothetical protein [Alphaproteobacteria bacterium]MBV8408139.1 hypothetical protein [Alphaproteobacteria bacterium]